MPWVLTKNMGRILEDNRRFVQNDVKNKYVFNRDNTNIFCNKSFKFNKK